MKENQLKIKSFAFAIYIVKISKEIRIREKDYILSKQLLRSGTAIGALIREAEFGQSRADFTNKMSIALKEANETDYWLSILSETRTIDDITFEKASKDCRELIAMLAASVKTSKKI